MTIDFGGAAPAAGRGNESLSPPWKRAVRRKLLRWYDRTARDLPWRSSDGSSGRPYTQWVAEVMLQQTQVETVTYYYDRFLRRFPDVHALAAARLDDVLTIWQGLGYYRRAEHLHRAARLVADRGGAWPMTADEWQRLPGIGPYTAGAIASMACGQRVAAIDGNVTRVLARLVPIEADLSTPAAKDRLRAAATDLLPTQRCGDFNQAWMDLGARLCRPRKPRCDLCPLSAECVGRRRGLIDELPRLQPPAAPKLEQRVVAALLSGNKILVQRRPRGGRWSGLWELPNAPGGRTDAAGVLGELCAALSLPPPTAPLYTATVSHRLTHRLYRFHVYRVCLAPGVRRRGGTSRRWIALDRLPDLPLATVQRRILRGLAATH